VLPIIDIEPLVNRSGERGAVAARIGAACREHGFFYIVGHGIDPGLQRRLEDQSRRFFALPLEEKMEIRMAKAGRAWRGYFPIGGELTSGKPDLKEGLYFGLEHADDDPGVRAGLPLHGQNLFPDALPEMRDTVLKYMSALTDLGHALMSGLSMSLGLHPDAFRKYTADPFVLFRIFHYPPSTEPEAADADWGVGEHTDYGVLTILKQDEHGGLEVKSGSTWVAAPPVPDAFVCNIGDMLERMTGGRYRSTPHRVRKQPTTGRFSFPFFFDPSFDARIEPLIDPAETERRPQGGRWDGADVFSFGGTYGEYLTAKVSKVFPELAG
jgi:isopenicillin N synthase-like dioxygenase